MPEITTIQAKRINKQVNQDLKNSTNQLNANKTCLSISETEVVLFRSARKHTDSSMKVKLNGKDCTLMTQRIIMV